MQMSSAQVAISGSQSENSMPLSPWRSNARGLAHTFAVGLINASFKSLVSDSGSGRPSHFFISGFGSNKSSWLGPPSIKSKIMFFALAGKLGGFGANGLVEG